MIQSYSPQRLDAFRNRLKELGLVTPQQLEQAKREQANTQERFSVILARLGSIRDADSGKRLAVQLGWMPQRLDASSVTVSLQEPFRPEWCRAHRVVPLKQPPAESLILVTDDPLTLCAIEWLEQRARTPLELALIREEDLKELLARLDQQGLLKPTITSLIVAEASEAGAAAGVSDEPIIHLVDSLLSEAVRLRASDIHIEPLVDRLRVRYRIDGVLHDVSSPPKPLQGSMTSRIKIMAGLNIAEKRHPQDGRLEVAGPPPLDVRVSTLPALHGESIVMRLLHRTHSIVGIKDLGLSAQDLGQWEELVRRPYGMVLVTGPTGSGKTTTLYATLAHLNRPDRKLITVEDPVEYQLAGVNQVGVKPAIGLTFAAGLRAMLRQAPDVIMVGEIRDQETAQIAIQAALTGHLVFSTLHTNDAPSAVTRLIDMGVAPFLVASTVQAVLAQRLVRRICLTCRAERPPSPEEQMFLGEPAMSQLAEGRGCEACHNSGYYGRHGIYELLCLTDPLRHLIVNKSQASGLKKQAIQEGMATLREDGRLKVREGLTTVAEVLRATPDAL